MKLLKKYHDEYFFKNKKNSYTIEKFDMTEIHTIISKIYTQIQIFDKLSNTQYNPCIIL